MKFKTYYFKLVYLLYKKVLYCFSQVQVINFLAEFNADLFHSFMHIQPQVFEFQPIILVLFDVYFESTIEVQLALFTFLFINNCPY